MLRTSELELKLKSHVALILRGKAAKWAAAKEALALAMLQMEDYFSGAAGGGSGGWGEKTAPTRTRLPPPPLSPGTRLLTAVERDDAMMEWFRNLAAEIRSLDLADTNVTGRKIASIIKGLEDVERFDAIDASRNIKDFLGQQRCDAPPAPPPPCARCSPPNPLPPPSQRPPARDGAHGPRQ